MELLNHFVAARLIKDAQLFERIGRYDGTQTLIGRGQPALGLYVHLELLVIADRAGPDTADRFSALVQSAGTVIWNGPVGVFEFEQFGEGTRAISLAIARSKAFSLAGGGDTLAAIEKYNIEDGISYISTGGGAFLEFVEGKTLPAVAALEERAKG